MLTLSSLRLPKSGFLRHILTLVTGAAVAQVVPLLASPLITRLYDPHEVGIQAVYVSWMSTLAVLATARYEMAIVLPASEKQASNLMGLSILFSTALAMLIVLLVLSGGHAHIAAHLGAPELEPWLALLPLSVLLAGLMQAWTNWNNRHRRYQANANGRMAQSFGMAGVQVAAGWLGAGAGGLILGQFAGQVGSLLAQAWTDLKSRFGWRRELSRRDMREAALAYIEFPKINAPHALSTALLDSATLAALTVLASTSAVGFYGLMMRVLKLPAALIGQAVAQVAYRELAEARNLGKPLRPILRKMMLMLFGLSLFPFLVIQIFGEPLFTLVFGAKWAEAGRYAEAMSLYILFHFIASPLGMVPPVINRQRFAFMLSLVQAVLFLGTLWLGFSLWQDAVATFQLVSVVMAGYFIAYFTWLYKAAK
ncbi:lipopolysaccharide biosynthesis protein [Chromobacterium sp. IIBBL 290-4]|uniref:lipopolysaccharide biosynthesis protein n=1 Tax=Chromobacterium sp. IIBBL 290-4 TaxID=2953890 RepID=UPI0020B67D1A|nr:lipopolysaccharide biosynthesis protein [Chromobacterium sp. IIBBL 290-4]UTH76472.1 lipopolysaccharide biosynthesis protein [Chromobacterium sp. IIBBL 290-4]